MGPGTASMYVAPGAKMIMSDGQAEEVKGYIAAGTITSPGTLYVEDGVTITGVEATYLTLAGTKTVLYAIEHNFDPQPANYSAANPLTVDTLSWSLPDPNNPGGTVTCDVIFTSDPNLPANAKIVDNQDLETIGISLEPGLDYYWQITVYDSAFAEPTIVSPVFTFNTRNEAPTADAGDDVQTWLVDSTRDIQLAGAVIDEDGSGPDTYLWEVTSNANDLNPATLDDATLANATVTLPESGWYTLSLVVNDGADPSEAADTMRIRVYADACAHAQAQNGYLTPVGDTDNDCDVDIADFAIVAADWLLDTNSTE